MKAIGLRRHDQPTILELMEIAVPGIDDNEVLVRIKAIGVGLHDRWYLPTKYEYPYVIGIEAAGIIEKTSESVTGHPPGSRVMFTSSMHPKGGVWAEFAAVPEAALVVIPDELDFVRAAALPVAGSTALESIRALGLSPNDSVFMAGASGAIGTLTIQLAKAIGCRIAASASSKNHEYMRSLGAEKTVDYRDPDWVDQVRAWMPEGVDAALAIQPNTGLGCLRVVKDGGKVVTVSGDPLTAERGIQVTQVMVGLEAKKALGQLASEVASGAIHVEVERTYPFDQGIEALEKTETRHARGKIVLTLP
ncbi:MAG: NADP-dependent oxidoreductase [Isosphaeraceae bacterium]